MARLLRNITAVTLVALVSAGCDKCGNRLPLVAPSMQHACGDNAQER